MNEFFWSEYELLYTTYEAYNDQSLLLKGWSVTVALAAIIAAYIERAGRSGKIAVVAATSSALAFWVVDAFWKSFQLAYLARLSFLETAENFSEITPSIVTSWNSSYGSLDWLGVLFFPSVALPHVFIVVLGLVLYFRFPPESN